MADSQTEMLDWKKKIKNWVRDFIDVTIFIESRFWKRSVTNNKLLIIRIDAMGDFLLFSPTLSVYRKLYPTYKIDLLVSTASYELAKHFQDNVDELSVFDRGRFNRSFIYRRRLFQSLYLAGYDVVIYPAYSRELTADRMVNMARARESIGFDGDASNISETARGKNNKFYTKLFHSLAVNLFELDRNYEFLEFLGYFITHDLPTLPSTLTKQEVLSLLQKKYVVVHPGASVGYRMWPLDRYVGLLKKLDDHFGGMMQFVVTGSKKEWYIGVSLKKALPNSVVNLTGKTNLPELISVLSGAQLFIGSDTSTAHFSAAVEIPILCIMGGGHLKRFFPYGDLKKNRVVYNTHASCLYDNWKCCEGLHSNQSAPCLASIVVDQVYDVVIEMLKTK